MAYARNYLEIKDKKISVIVRKYSNSDKIKIYFKSNVLNISMPRMVSKRDFENIIKENENLIYKQYNEIIKTENSNIKHWYTGEKILYQGEFYEVELNKIKEDRLQISIQEEEKKILINISQNLSEEQKKQYIDINLKKLFKRNTQVLIGERLPFWSKKTNINYSDFKVGDSTSQFGSCNVNKKELHFSNRLIMLPEDKVDAIIVHELCHIKYANHSQEFYNLVKKFIPNYEEIDKWLKQNAREIII